MTSEIKPEDVNLPPLPEPDDTDDCTYAAYSAEALQAYARLAVLQERERCAGIVMAHCAADGKMDCAPLFNAAAAIRAGHSITETPLGEG